MKLTDYYDKEFFVIKENHPVRNVTIRSEFKMQHTTFFF